MAEPARSRTGLLPAAILVLLLLATVLSLAWWRGSGTDRSGTPPQTGLDAELRRLVRELPRRGDGRFRAPTPAQAAALADAYRAMRAGRVKEAAELARPLGYRLLRADDPGGRWLVLTERPGARGPRGWGLYAHAPAASGSLAVEVAHPVADRRTEALGVELARAAGASDLLVAGAHRDAASSGRADAAHAPVSAFLSVHGALARLGVPAVQPHGFDEDRPGRASLGDAVLSSGAARSGPIVEAAARTLRRAGLEVCLYDGDACAGLGGTTNVQGATSRRADAPFLHVELASRWRATGARRARVVRALAAALDR